MWHPYLNCFFFRLYTEWFALFSNKSVYQKTSGRRQVFPDQCCYQMFSSRHEFVLTIPQIFQITGEWWGSGECLSFCLVAVSSGLQQFCPVQCSFGRIHTNKCRKGKFLMGKSCLTSNETYMYINAQDALGTSQM